MAVAEAEAVAVAVAHSSAFAIAISEKILLSVQSTTPIRTYNSIYEKIAAPSTSVSGVPSMSQRVWEVLE